MGHRFSSSRPEGLSREHLGQLVKETELSKSSLRKLYSRFLHLDRGKKGYLDRSDFLTVPEVNNLYSI